MRIAIAIAIEVEVPDGTRLDALDVESVSISHADDWVYHYSTLEGQGIPIVRHEIHADAVFGEDDHPLDCGYCQAGEPMRHNYEPGE